MGLRCFEAYVCSNVHTCCFLGFLFLLLILSVYPLVQANAEAAEESDP